MISRPRSRNALSCSVLICRDAARRGRLRLLAGAVAAGALVGGASLGLAINQDAPAAPTGIAGLWPDFPPDTLSQESFARIGGKWSDWGQAAAVDVAALYGLRDASLEEQRAVLARLQSDVRVLEQALQDSAYKSIWPDLTRVYGPLARRAEIAQAALEVLTADARPAAAVARRAAAEQVRTAINALKDDLRPVPDSSPWLDYVQAEQILANLANPDALRPLLERLPAKLNPAAMPNPAQAKFLKRPAFGTLAAAARDWSRNDRLAERGIDQAAVREKLSDLIVAIDAHDALPTDATGRRIIAARTAFTDAAGSQGDPLLDVLRINYLNYNLRLVADEPFLAKMVAVHDIQCGPVADCVKGATVRGTQQTTSDATLNVLPDNNVARFQLELNGVANTRTLASTSQATISSVGRNDFYATKPITFDGRQFSTNPASVSVQPYIRHVGAATKYDGLFFGLFKNVIRREALKRANQELPFSRSYASSKLKENLLPRFNSEIADNFADLNTQLAGLTARAEQLGVGPQLIRTRTTDDRFLYDLVVRNPREVAGSPPNLNAARGVGFTLQLHESLLNNTADRWGFAGKTMNGDEIQTQLEGWFSQLLGKTVVFNQRDPNKPNDPTRLIFAESDPIKFRIADGALTLILRAGIEQPEGENIPPQIVEVPLNLSVRDSVIALERGTVRVSPLGRPANRATQFARAGVMRRKLEESVNDSTINATIRTEREGRGPVTIQIFRIDAEAGWLTVYGA